MTVRRVLVRRVMVAMGLLLAICVEYFWINQQLDEVSRVLTQRFGTMKSSIFNDSLENSRRPLSNNNQNNNSKKQYFSGVDLPEPKSQEVSLDITATATTNTTNTASSWLNSTTSTRRPWPSCQPSLGLNPDEIRRIFYVHSRKTGGSYIRRLLNRVAKRYNWTVVAKEGNVYLPELEPKQRKRDTLYITQLRHPVHRAISHYKYEGRWNCRQLVQNKTLFVPTPENAQSLHDYMEQSRARNSRNCGRVSKRVLLWQCTELCYLGWFGGAIPNCVPPSELSQLYNTALERLSRFNLIIITEWLKDANYRKGLFEMFGLSNVSTNLKTGMYCDKESKYWNSQYPAILQNDTIRRLYDVNKWDMKLYETVTRNCSSESVAFPAAPMTG